MFREESNLGDRGPVAIEHLQLLSRLKKKKKRLSEEKRAGTQHHGGGHWSDELYEADNGRRRLAVELDAGDVLMEERERG